ncbi:PP2C family protein-serine/threonine phosphatase [Actinoplanes sp. RD1]|uniref:PP2C family protein-serine/threonine phosphatase n=1 Tax=Actinoplanes sp. RD1 TaxID=3064538 RepID=UPI002742160D|nr:SpoIIE family protein phosphatase [Actinoplanes sp. RD1]
MSDDIDRRIGEASTIRDRFDAISLLLASYDGPDLRVTAANAAFRSFVGRDHVVGLTYHELFPEFAGQQVSAMVEKIYASGEAQTGREWRFQVGDSDDTRREYFMDFVIEPYLDEAGAVAGITAIGIDVTDEVRRRRAEQDRAVVAEQRYARALDVIRTLQQQLLPAGLPVLPAVQIAASYLLADADTAAGGDWFDAIPTPDGRVALVVGDVVGHGVAASAAMGQLRTVLQDRLDETGDVLGAIRAADRMARRVPAAHAATVCVAVLDPADGALAWCSAGHPPPLVVNAQAARYLPLSGAGPLGTGAAYRLQTERLEDGEMVLLYSDGIIERPGREPAAATVELSQVAIDSVAGRGFDPSLHAVERASTQTLELLVRQSGHTDDITLLAAQRRVPTPPLYVSGGDGQDGSRRSPGLAGLVRHRRTRHGRAHARGLGVGDQCGRACPARHR